MGSKRVECLWDVVRFGLALRITCLNPRCGHVAIVDPAPFLVRSVMKRWRTGLGRALGRHFTCARCGHRGNRAEAWTASGVEPGSR